MFENRTTFNKIPDGKNEFLMDRDSLQKIVDKKTIENSKFLDELDKRINQITQNNKFGIFNKLMEKNKEAKDNNKVDDSKKAVEFYNEDDLETDILSKYGFDEKLINLPDDVLGKILAPLNHEIRQTVYVQRDKLTLAQAAMIYRRWVNDKVVCFHVRERELETNELKADKKSPEKAIFFSTDINKLFDLHSAKYIYAFRIGKSTLRASQYEGAPEHFGRLEGAVEVEDSIKIFSEEDPAYRHKTMKTIGADFDKSYAPDKRRQ